MMGYTPQPQVPGIPIASGGTLLRSDNFNRADGAIGTPSDGGSAWSQDIGANWAVISNGAGQTGVVGSGGIATLEAGNANVDVQATLNPIVSTPSADMGLIARFVDINNYICAFVIPGTSSWILRKMVAGSFTNVATFSGAVVSGDVIKLSCPASNVIKVYQNGVERMSFSISEGSSNTRHGLELNFNSGPESGTFDDFSITSN